MTEPRGTRGVKIGSGVRQECCLSPILFSSYSKCLTKEALEGFGDFKIGGQIIYTEKYADDLIQSFIHFPPIIAGNNCYHALDHILKKRYITHL